MQTNDVKPLHPLPFGNVLIVGVKTSNVSEELRTHPRVIMWDSQQEHWTNKDLPSNVRAVFVTRFIGHAAFNRILSECRKKQITMFNPEGTGMIAKQVKELLDIRRTTAVKDTPVKEQVPQEPEKEQETMATTTTGQGKLKALIPFIDYHKGNRDNSVFLMEKAKELGITSTYSSLANFVGVERKKLNIPTPRRYYTPKKRRTFTAKKVVDVSVEMFDNIIKELQDMRAYLVEVTKENQSLKARLDKFRKMIEE